MHFKQSCQRIRWLKDLGLPIRRADSCVLGELIQKPFKTDLGQLWVVACWTVHSKVLCQCLFVFSSTTWNTLCRWVGGAKHAGSHLSTAFSLGSHTNLSRGAAVNTNPISWVEMLFLIYGKRLLVKLCDLSSSQEQSSYYIIEDQKKKSIGAAGCGHGRHDLHPYWKCTLFDPCLCRP